MAEHKNETDTEPKKKWVRPEMISVSGLDSCVEFLYGVGGNATGTNGPLSGQLP